MARARNIKPGFFKNEELAECTSWARLCFAGLWTLADRDGRLEDRPKRIRGELFAFDDEVTIGPLLDELVAHGFILRYRTSDGLRAIQILKFEEHQTPHYAEKPSTIEPPNLVLGGHHDVSNPGLALGSRADDEARNPENVVLDPSIKRGSKPPDSLIPDSLIPDTPIPSRDTVLTHGSVPPSPDERPPLVLNGDQPPKLPDCPQHEVLALWAETLPAMPQHEPAQWNRTRAEHLRARWRETAVAEHWTDKGEGLAYFRRLFRYVGRSPFLTGHVKPREKNGKAFTIELEWLVSPGNWSRVIEGKYHEGLAP